jgi:hypothetical protein
MKSLSLTYYGPIFPAQRKTPAMPGGTSKRSCKNLSAAAIIPVLFGEVPSRSKTMLAAGEENAGLNSEYLTAEPPAKGRWEDLREAARGCRACPLWREATQTVFGEGSRSAKIMLLGSNLAMRKIAAGVPLSVPRENCSTRRWRRPVLTGQGFTSLTW